jgi:UDP-2-acetamido-2,6-beta-L-arabino-hexul-4-ose reductase
MKVSIEKIDLSADPRGFVFMALPSDRLTEQRSIHIAVTQPGCVRGNHYHRMGTEVLIVFGPGLVRLRDQSKMEDIRVGNGEVVRFILPAGVSHALKNIGVQPTTLIAFSTTAQIEDGSDTVADVLIDP